MRVDLANQNAQLFLKLFLLDVIGSLYYLYLAWALFLEIVTVSLRMTP